MGQARKPSRQQAGSLRESIRQFLTAEVWKQVRKAAPKRRIPRWDVRPLIFVLLTMAWFAGDSLEERFEGARGFYVLCHEKQRRPGETFAGFQKALARLPMPVLRALGRAVRGRIEKLLADRWEMRGLIPLGCDGSRLECPRTPELEQRLGNGGKEGSAPTVWVTAIVDLVTGVPYCWRLGKGGKASERHHLIRMLQFLPAMALIVADAGYHGYELVQALIENGTRFLIRMSSSVRLYVDADAKVPLEEFSEGLVYLWPENVQRKGLPPITARLLCIRDQKRKVDVWLLTNILSPAELSHREANRLYRWRWENEGYFRTYKQTMRKMKLLSRTVREVHREAEASMIATQLLLAQGALAMPKPRPLTGASQDEDPRVMCSPRNVLKELRQELMNLPRRRGRGRFLDRLRACQRERRPRTSPKSTRVWPRRKPHKPPGPPEIRELNATQKARISGYSNAT